MKSQQKTAKKSTTKKVAKVAQRKVTTKAKKTQTTAATRATSNTAMISLNTPSGASTTSSRSFATTTQSVKAKRSFSQQPLSASINQFGVDGTVGTMTFSFPQKKASFLTQKSLRKFTAGALPSHEVLSMPALSPTMEQGTIAAWVKKIGEKINPGEVICDVTTDKATVAFEATDEGYLAAILVEAGSDIIQVGTPVAIVVEEESDVAAFKNYKHGAAATEAAPAAAEAPAAPKAEKQISEQKSCGVYIAPESPKAVQITQSGGRVAASPLARVTANEMGVDISQITGTGMFGAVTQADVKNHKPVAKPVAAAAVETPAAVAAPVKSVAAPATGDFVDEQLTPMRKVIAQRLTQSKQTVPHYYITVEIEMTQVNQLRAQFNKQLAAAAGKDEKPTKLSVNDFIIKASSAALKKVPDVNSAWQDTSIRRYNYVDISVAVATDAGLITPIIADADLKGLAGISTEMKSLAARARQGKLQLHEFQGGTFTISNLGMFGVDQFSAIINPPQAAILAIGGTQQKVIANPSYDATVAGSQQFKAVDVMKVTASFDHRVVDGAVGAQFLSELKGYLENPTKLLL